MGTSVECVRSSYLPNDEKRKVILALAVILLLAFAIRIWVALALPNIDYPDELFQTLEPAHSLAYHSGIVTWEYRVGCRSWVLPGVLAGIMRTTAWLAPGSRGYLIGVIGFLCLLSLNTVLFAFGWAYRTAGMTAAIISGVAAASWFELVYFASKAFSEVVATNLFLPAVYLAIFGRCFTLRQRFFLAGLLCGFATGLRLQFAPAVALLAVYSCRQQWKEKWVPLLAGTFLVVTGFGLLDALTWSYPFQSTILYVSNNLHLPNNLLPRSAMPHFGTAPWYFFLVQLGKYLGPVIILAFAGARKSPVLAWLVLAIVVPHSLISHKEYRFVYPALPLLITLAAVGLASVLASMIERFPILRTQLVAVSVGIALFVSLSAIYATHIARWKAYSGNLRAFQALSARSDLCGVGLFGVPWDYSGGYTYLHQPVPIYPVDSDKDFGNLAQGFNYAVSSLPPPTLPDVYKLNGCWASTCVYERSGACTKVPGHDINAVLKQKGE